jgi:hypothetical protein
MPAIAGGVLSIFSVAATELNRPTPFVAEQVKVVAAVSVVMVLVAHPDEDLIPDSGSLTVQLTITSLRYHPLLPRVPAIFGRISGGVVSIADEVTVVPPVS